MRQKIKILYLKKRFYKVTNMSSFMSPKEILEEYEYTNSYPSYEDMDGIWIWMGLFHEILS